MRIKRNRYECSNHYWKAKFFMSPFMQKSVVLFLCHNFLITILKYDKVSKFTIENVLISRDGQIYRYTNNQYIYGWILSIIRKCKILYRTVPSAFILCKHDKSSIKKSLNKLQNCLGFPYSDPQGIATARTFATKCWSNSEVCVRKTKKKKHKLMCK